MIFLNSTPDQRLPDLYACAELLLAPSFYEGFGIPVLEAMGAGLPAPISGRPSLPEIAGGAARLVSPDDPPELPEAIWSLLHDGAARAAMRERGLARIRAFDPSTIAATVLARYGAMG